MRALAIFLIRAYQLLISPMLGSRCRFYPSCSNYALEALRLHGLPHGSWLALRRLARCHPLCAGGVDPVPPAVNGHAWEQRCSDVGHQAPHDSEAAAHW
jgi:uncharacterized protein